MLRRNGNSKGRRMHYVLDLYVHLCVRMYWPGGGISHNIAVLVSASTQNSTSNIIIFWL